MAKRIVEVPGYEGRGWHVQEGENFRIIDVEGDQIGDLFLISEADRMEYCSPSVTRASQGDHWFPRVGEPFLSNRRRPMATFIEDATPGKHDMSFAPCDSGSYQEWGLGDDHPSCRENFCSAARDLGIEIEPIPDPINVFQNTPSHPDGRITIDETLTSPGDYIVLQAEMDLIVLLAACSVDLMLDGVLVNGGQSTPLRVEIGNDR